MTLAIPHAGAAAPLILTRADWACRGIGLRPQPGTWCPVWPDRNPDRWPAMQALHRLRVWAVVGCPACGSGVRLDRLRFRADGGGAVSPAWACPCGLHRILRLASFKAHAALFAVAIESATATRIEYTRASSAVAARAAFGQPAAGERIVGVARAVGVPVDEKGTVILR